ncbi:nucleotidyltransferase substrate binding protein [Microbulbifer pacificus]|uniref:nucleotidyltransferase substrate binding protein n=1 Tax=Microbulbifer pacificus TaxID=407164 RepID=UPI000CF37B96|nr:nucleotidyltransferase substrate binding protein [Microbulbifer pacificus]
MTAPDIRWLQRFENYQKALAQLQEAVELQHQRALSNIEKQGFIKAFEFTHELAWNVLKDFARYQGDTQIMGSRDATRFAFKNELIEDGDSWMAMIADRNRAVHAYDEKTVLAIIERTRDVYYPLFRSFQRKMQQLSSNHGH